MWSLSVNFCFLSCPTNTHAGDLGSRGTVSQVSKCCYQSVSALVSITALLILIAVQCVDSGDSKICKSWHGWHCDRLTEIWSRGLYVLHRWSINKWFGWDLKRVCTPLVFSLFFFFSGFFLAFFLYHFFFPFFYLLYLSPYLLLQHLSLSGWLPTSVPVSGSWLGQK